MLRQSVAAREVRSIRTSFAQLARSFARLEPLLADAAQAKGNSRAQRVPRPRRTPRLSAKQRATLKLQGRYMGTMRGLSVKLRARVKKVRATKGMRAAIAEARRLVG